MRGTLTQEGYDVLEEGPETVKQFVDKINGMGWRFDDDDFYVLSGEYLWAAIVDLPSEETAAQIADLYARTGRGQIQTEVIVANGSDGYEEYMTGLLE